MREITFSAYSKLQIISPMVVEYTVNTDDDNNSKAGMEQALALLVDALCFKPEGCGIEFRLGGLFQFT
jgi:hypothetical protein